MKKRNWVILVLGCLLVISFSVCVFYIGDIEESGFFFTDNDRSQDFTESIVHTENDAVEQQQILQENVTDSVSNAPIVQHNVEGLSAAACIRLFSEENRDAYNFWVSIFNKVHPEFLLYGAGTHCLLTDGTHLVSYSFFKGDPAENQHVGVGQSIMWFDKDYNLIDETKDLYQQTIGDIGTPGIESVNDGKALFLIGGSDIELTIEVEYELNLRDFSYKVTKPASL